MTLSGVGVIYGYRMAPANDGGLFLLGHTSVDIPASYDSCIVKVDAAGSIEWHRVLRKGAGAGNTQFLRSIFATGDGGCVVGGSGAIVMKFEPDGDVAWHRSFGREGAHVEFADLRQTADDGYLLLANSVLEDSMGIVTDRDILLVKLDPLGNPIWQRTFGGPLEDNANALAELPFGEIAVCGGTTFQPGEGGRNLLFLRLTSSGEIVWQTAVHQDDDGGVSSIAATLDGGLIATGLVYEGPTAFNWDAWVLKLAPGGAVEWTRTYHGDHWDNFSSVATMSDGGYLAAGSSNSFSSHSERALLVRLSPNGDIEWQRTYGRQDPADGGYSSGRGVFPAPDGSLYLAGTTSFGGMGGICFLLMKTSPAGLVERLPGFVADVGLEVRDSAFEILPAALISQDVPVVSSAPELTPLDVAIRGGLLFAPPLNAAVVRTSTRSLALLGRSNVLTWEPNPANDDLEIAKYRIYAVGPIPPSNGDLIVLPDDAFHLYEVDGGMYRFEHSPLKAGGYECVIWGVGADGGEGLAVRPTQLNAGQRP
ncbi:MAG: hypothetical protein ACM32H_02125 [Candidatus Aminicenantes bacterium RBG_16_66_30]